MRVPAFKDPSVRQAFAVDGYVVFPGLAAPLLPELRAIYGDAIAALSPDDPYFATPMTGTNYIGDAALRRKTVGAVRALVANLFDSVLEGHRVVGAGFRVKMTGDESHLPLHQDPSMVDEDVDWSMNFILPLLDTHARNGALRLVPGSHRVLPKLRSLDLLDRAETLGFLDQLGGDAITLPLAAGDAVLYFNSLLHGSGRNDGDRERCVVLGTLMTAETPMTIYLRDPADMSRFERFEVADDYFNELDDFEREVKDRPKTGRRLEDVRYDFEISPRAIVDGIRTRWDRPAP